MDQKVRIGVIDRIMSDFIDSTLNEWLLIMGGDFMDRNSTII
jgi:hypothetical protein